MSLTPELNWPGIRRVLQKSGGQVVARGRAGPLAQKNAADDPVGINFQIDMTQARRRPFEDGNRQSLARRLAAAPKVREKG